jgi:hypothetical protein
MMRTASASVVDGKTETMLVLIRAATFMRSSCRCGGSLRHLPPPHLDENQGRKAKEGLLFVNKKKQKNFFN